MQSDGANMMTSWDESAGLGCLAVLCLLIVPLIIGVFNPTAGDIALAVTWGGALLIVLVRGGVKLARFVSKWRERDA